MEDFKDACEEMNEKERKGSKGSKGRKGPKEKEEEEEEEEGKENRKDKQPMCCKSDNSLLGPTMDRVMDQSGIENICSDLEG